VNTSEKMMKPSNTEAIEKNNVNRPEVVLAVESQPRPPDISNGDAPIVNIAHMGMLGDLPPEVQVGLAAFMDDAETAESIDDTVTVETCPKCGSRNIIDCEKITPILDARVRSCLDCGQVWCLECDALFTKGQIRCDHWDLCSECSFPKEWNGVCLLLSSLCPRLIKRRAMATKPPALD
jgi:hypothetical protein